MYFVEHYSEKEYKCNKNIPDLKIISLGIFLCAISMHYMQLDRCIVIGVSAGE